MQTIRLTDYQYTLCRLFSAESAKTQQAIEFGQRNTKARSLDEIRRDTLIGKMAEAAISTFLREYGEHRPVNWDVYPKGEGDDEDFTVNGWRWDIKSTRAGRYLLLERNRIQMRKRSGTMPDVIVMCRTAWDRDRDQPQEQTVDIIGCISVARLTDPGNGKVIRLRRGECIPGTKARLQADNYAVRFDDLADLRGAAEYMTRHRKTA